MSTQRGVTGRRPRKRQAIRVTAEWRLGERTDAWEQLWDVLRKAISEELASQRGQESS